MGDALKDLPAKPFDVVMLSNVLEHLSGRAEFLRRVQIAARPIRLLIRVPLFERDWRVPLKRTWKGILVHHSATEAGNMALLDKHHKEANGWLGIGYDFLIDNGTGAADGLVETTFRWKQQIQGAHAGPGLHEYNDHWIGVCLVGNFNDGRPTRAQMKSLVRLVRFLQEYCGIPEENIRVHRDIRDTECPGRKFPLQELRRDFPRAK